MELSTDQRQWNRRGAVIFETVFWIGVLMIPLFLLQVKWLHEKRLELQELQKTRLPYDGILLWK